jgi:polyhydroxyalkanoate synthesis regulator protein
MENFAANQEQIRRYIEGTFGQFFPMGQFEDMARQNMALFQRAATMFTPAKAGNAAHGRQMEGNAGAHDPSSEVMSPPGTSAEIKVLSNKIEDLQKQICALIEAQAPKD